MTTKRGLLAAALTGLLSLPAAADPCGMVPPIYLGQGTPIVRIGAQKTFVFYKNGIESIVIRPGFRGKVAHFGMLIPFPSPPALRKMPDEIFGHIARAIDPPPVVIDLRPRDIYPTADMAMARSGAAPERSLGVNQVRVLREEAVGMYQVAVLEAGSAGALKAWMDRHGYRYPEGMDRPVEDYVRKKWCFVAVKTKVGPASKVQPRPGMKQADASLPDGASFDGHVQAMGFRFRTDSLVVPMRLSAFNDVKGGLRNIVYVLSEDPCQVADLDVGLVKRQLPGRQLLRNVTQLLPIRVIGGTLADVPARRIEALARQRDPRPKNGLARELFASDLHAVANDRLSNPDEEAEKELLRIGERLMLRGAHVDRMHHAALTEMRKEADEAALGQLDGMTMTVIDGDLPKQHLASRDLTFPRYVMPDAMNASIQYDAVAQGKPHRRPGRVYREGDPFGIPRWWFIGGIWIALMAIVVGVKVRARRAPDTP